MQRADGLTKAELRQTQEKKKVREPATRPKMNPKRFFRTAMAEKDLILVERTEKKKNRRTARGNPEKNPGPEKGKGPTEEKRCYRNG